MTDIRPSDDAPRVPAGLAPLVNAVVPPDGAAPADVRARLDGLAKPPGSLGRLEELAVRLAAVRGDPPRPLRDRVVFVLAGDHGVVRRGVSAYSSGMTAAMCRTFAVGGAAVNALAASAGCRVVAADFGVEGDPGGGAGVLDRKVRPGTADLVEGPAMGADEAVAAVLRGAALLDEGPLPDVAALGEMGIGNTTAASAITALLTGAPADAVVGPGTGVAGRGLARKRDAVRSAVRRVTAAHGPPGPFRILREVGGLEIAGLAGLTLRAAGAGVPVVADGFIATAAAALAVELAPGAGAYLFAGHRSAEPGHDLLLERLGVEPVLDLELRLGEGTGAVLSLPILEGAGAILREMVTLEELGVRCPGAGAAGDAP